MRNTVKTVVIIFILSLLISGCSGNDMPISAFVPGQSTTLSSGDAAPSGEYIDVTLSFVSANPAENNRLIEKEIRKIKLDREKSLEQQILDELFKGPVSTKAKSIIPKDIYISSISVVTNNLMIVLDEANGSGEAISSENGIDMTLIRSTILLSITENIDYIHKVGVYLENIELNRRGEPLYLLSANDIVDEKTLRIGEENIALYFLNKSGSALRIESRTVQKASDETHEQMLINELFKGPSDSDNMTSMFNPNSKLIDCFEEKGIKFLNFSEPILSEGTNFDQKMLSIYAIVNTITEPRENPSKIQILIGGKNDEDITHLMSTPYFERKEDLIEYPK